MHPRTRNEYSLSSSYTLFHSAGLPFAWIHDARYHISDLPFPASAPRFLRFPPFPTSHKAPPRSRPSTARSEDMSSAQGHSSPPTLTEGPEEGYVEGQQIQQEVQIERLQESPVGPEPQLQSGPQPEHEPQQEVERIASSSHPRVVDQPPQTPPKDRNSEGRLSVNSTFLLGGSPQVDVVTL